MRLLLITLLTLALCLGLGVGCKGDGDTIVVSPPWEDVLSDVLEDIDIQFEWNGEIITLSLDFILDNIIKNITTDRDLYALLGVYEGLEPYTPESNRELASISDYTPLTLDELRVWLAWGLVYHETSSFQGLPDTVKCQVWGIFTQFMAQVPEWWVELVLERFNYGGYAEDIPQSYDYDWETPC